MQTSLVTVNVNSEGPKRKWSWKTIAIIALGIIIVVLLIIGRGFTLKIEKLGVELSSCTFESLIDSKLDIEVALMILQNNIDLAKIVGDKVLVDSLTNLNYELTKLRNDAEFLYKKYQFIDTLDAESQAKLRNEIVGFITKSTMPKKVINAGLKDQSPMVYKIVDSMTTRIQEYKDIADEYKYKLSQRELELKNIQSNYSAALSEKDEYIQYLLNKTIEDSTLSAQEREMFLNQIANLTEQFNNAMEINRATQPIRVTYFEFRPVSAKGKRSDDIPTYKLNDVRSEGIIVNFKLEKNNSLPLEVDSIVVLFIYKKEGVENDIQYPDTVAINIQKTTPIIITQNDIGGKFKAGLYTCAIYYNSTQIYSSRFNAK